MGKSIPRLMPPVPLAVNTVVPKVLKSFEQHRCDIVQLGYGVPFNVFCLRNPRHIRFIATAPQSATTKPPHVMPKADWMKGDGLFNDLGGESWEIKRQAVSPAFSEKQAVCLCELLPDTLEQLKPRWRRFGRDKDVDLYFESMRLVIDYAAASLFSWKMSSEDLDWVTREIPFVEHMFVTLTPLWVPTPSNLRFRSVSARFNRLLDDILRERRRNVSGQTDLLYFLLSSPDEKTGLPRTDAEIKPAMFATFFGTMAMAMPILWSIYFLADRPEMLQRLRGELEKVCGSRVPTREDLKQLPYFGCFIKETLRIYPPFWGSLRYSETPLQMDGYEFPARSVFAMIRIAAHHHPDYWQAPEAFMPDRFLAEEMQRGPREAYMPFGLGPRFCVGRHMALQMVPAIVAFILRNFDISITSPRPVRLHYGFGVHPLETVTARIQPKD